eukprot:TRINITY_DN17146_c0_g1_i1.p2 TRINITY_DN17146_c0_g1~~TRINITY_DN17146_c0_g1_i1.p2  ORF type:complete len:237 (-),score=80.24 TRINITY_DN17146_c0_g1_i1:99-761(-)
MEVEALQAIYGQDFTLLESGPYVFTIQIVCPPAKHFAEEAQFVLQVSFTPFYPNELPLLVLRDPKNVSAEEMLQMDQVMQVEAQRNAGSAMIYCVAQRAKEWLEERRAQYEPPKLVEKEPEVRHGTIVTPQSFTKWWSRFLKDHPEKMPQLPIAATTSSGKVPLTGRQMFERDTTMVASDAQFTESTNAPAVDWSLFSAEEEEAEEEEDTGITFDDPPKD